MGVLLWVVYFGVVAFMCHFLYMKARGTPPASRHLSVIIEGKSVSALNEWEARDRRLQRLYIAIVIALLLFPLLLPWLLRTN